MCDQAEAEGTFQFFHTNGATAQHDDATTKLLEKGVKALESKGLKYAEDAACDATAAIGPEGPLFCGMLFESGCTQFRVCTRSRFPIVVKRPYRAR